MKLYLVESASLDALKQNLPSLLTEFNKDNCDWIEEKLGKSPFIATKFPEIPQFSLDMTAEEPSKTDGKNAEIILYGVAGSDCPDSRCPAAHPLSA